MQTPHYSLPDDRSIPNCASVLLGSPELLTERDVKRQLDPSPDDCGECSSQNHPCPNRSRQFRWRIRSTTTTNPNWFQLCLAIHRYPGSPNCCLHFLCYLQQQQEQGRGVRRRICSQLPEFEERCQNHHKRGLTNPFPFNILYTFAPQLPQRGLGFGVWGLGFGVW